MAQVRAKVPCFVDNGFRREGDVFDYTGPKNTNLEYLSGAPVEREEAAVEQAPADEAPATAKKWTPKAKRASADEGSV